ncbi:hypothetical protein GWI33_000584 [Rhynchophorus ferrugineus]|uniref:Uncharacterized protein n=1 Tax=Rhynchophorus ferrugineus TaxID=354439 RepID=A0A834HM93_RHYFE|nr:hypothetical protein GWI33_000584 [Rhynchophorus ferrugineus]
MKLSDSIRATTGFIAALKTVCKATCRKFRACFVANASRPKTKTKPARKTTKKNGAEKKPTNNQKEPDRQPSIYTNRIERQKEKEMKKKRQFFSRHRYPNVLAEETRAQQGRHDADRQRSPTEHMVGIFLPVPATLRRRGRFRVAFPVGGDRFRP